MDTIEFHKRGLPHVHILITLLNLYKLRTPQEIDKFISSEIPDPNKYPRLHELVMKHMIHGPCGDWCIVKNKCSKNFPKSFRDKTIIDGSNKPIYRCRNDRKTYKKSPNFEVYNRYAVPYSPKL